MGDADALVAGGTVMGDIRRVHGRDAKPKTYLKGWDRA